MNAFFGCLIWLPLMFWVLSLVQWMIMGDIDVLLGVLAIGAGIGLGMVAMFSPLPILSPVSFVVLVGTMVLYPFARAALERRELRSADIEALERTYLVLGQKPMNPVSRFRLATHLWSLGMPGPAISIAEESLKTMPETLFRDEHRQVAAWRSAPLRLGTVQSSECPTCGAANGPSEVYCCGCGAPYLLDRLKSRIVPGGFGKRLIATWVAMVVILMGIPAATVLPPLLTVLSISVQLVLVAVVLWLAFRPILEASS